jgi:hypothetical protein
MYFASGITNPQGRSPRMHLLKVSNELGYLRPDHFVAIRVETEF